MASTKYSNVTPRRGTSERASSSVEQPSALPRVTLPKNLAATLQRLEDHELDALQQAVGQEIKRRRTSEPAVEAPESHAVAPAKASGTKVPAGKANLIRASFQTGMKPSAIARSLRISRAVVDQVLGTQAKPKR